MFIATSKLSAAEDLAPNSKSAILIEESSKEILYQKNIHEKLAPASMTKIMSMLLIMESVDSGKISLDDTVTISENAASMGGSQIFLEEGSKVKVSELLKGVAVASGNDAVVALSEKVAGSEAEFVELMNKRASQLGLKNTNFKNPHGLDDSDHYSSAYDMSVIALELLKHPKILEYTSIYEEYLNKPDGSSIWLVNTNKLVRFYEGVDGLKTGYTSTAGYCLTATAKKNNLRLISVVMNAETSDKRSADIVKMLNYGFNGYKINTILEKKTDLGKIKIENGKQEAATLMLFEDISELQKITDDNKKYSFNIKKNKVTAPIKSGDEVGTLEIISDNKVIKKVPLTIKEDIKKASIINLFGRNLKIIISGKNPF